MIRKYLTLALLGSALAINSVFANSVTTVVQPGTMVNLLSGFNGSVRVQQIIVAANTTNVSSILIDAPTNALSFVNPAYTNTTSYVTNWNTTWTDFYGVTRTNPVAIYALIDLTNNAVASTTNLYPQRVGIATLASTSTRYDQVDYYFNRGVWVTNPITSGIATITITY